MENKKWLKFLPLLLALVIFVIKIILNWNLISQKFNFEKVSNLYKVSQFADNPEDRKEIIQDNQLYVYAGIEYLTFGNLDKINIEHPPLGKYLFGLMFLLTSRPTLIQIPFGFLFLFFSYLLSLKVLKSEFWAGLVPLLLVMEKMFTNQLISTFLDLAEITFILVFFNLLLTNKEKNVKDWIFIGIILGLISTVKFPAVVVILILSLLIYEITQKKFNFKYLLLITIITGLIYVFSYSQLIFNKGIGSFIETQIGAIRIHASHVPEYHEIAALRVMILNQWPVWWDKIDPIWKAEEWQFSWIFLAIAILLSPFLLWKVVDKRIILFSLIYYAFINLRLFFPHYLFLLLPFMYLIFFAEIKIMMKFFEKHRSH